MSDVTGFRTHLTRLSRRLRQEGHNDPESWTRMLVISAIDRLGPDATPTEIATQEGMRSSNLAAVLRALEKSGLISRKPDERDGRITRLFLTSTGKDLLAKSRRDRDEWLHLAMEEVLSDEERQALLRVTELLGRLADSRRG